MSGFDLEASTEVDLQVGASDDGAALVSGRLLADITRALPPHPVDVVVDGTRLSINCGAARFTLPMMVGAAVVIVGVVLVITFQKR